MRFCTKCGNRLDEGVKFCTKCGPPVENVTSGQNSGNYSGNTQASSARLWRRTYNVGRTDYRTLYNVTLVSKPSQHTVFHIAAHLVEFIILIYILIVFFPVLLPVLIQAEGSSEIEYVPGMFPGLSATILISIISGIIQLKIRYDIIHALPKGFDYWKIKRILQWQIFGFESLKAAILRLLRKNDVNYPELGVGTDYDGNYYAFVVPGKDVSQYPYHQFT